MLRNVVIWAIKETPPMGDCAGVQPECVSYTAYKRFPHVCPARQIIHEWSNHREIDDVSASEQGTPKQLVKPNDEEQDTTTSDECTHIQTHIDNDT